jgi:Gamma-glutamyl cyclotransferase, AIG2-like
MPKFKFERTAPLYFAYGSNLNVAQMKRRCPSAKQADKLFLPNGHLVFRGVADVASADKSEELMVAGGLWRITADCEAAMDVYEGYNARYPKSGLYRKCYLLLKLRSGKEVPCLYYKMNASGVMPPSEGYVAAIKQGYKDFDLPLQLLEDAVQYSHEYKDKTPFMRRRHKAKGHYKFATGLTPRKKEASDGNVHTEIQAPAGDQGRGSLH